MSRTGKRMLMTALVVAFFVGYPHVGAEPVERAKPFLDTHTALVLRMDVTRFDVSSTWKEIAAAGGIGSSAAGESQKVISRWVSRFREAGGREIYGFLTLADLPRDGAFVIVIAQKNRDLDALRPLFSGLISSRGPFRICRRVGDVLYCGSEETLKRLREGQNVERPSLAKAFSAVRDGPIQGAVLVSADTRRVIRETMPRLPQELGGGSSEVITSGLRWAGLGLSDSPRISMRLVIQSEDHRSAIALREFIQRIYSRLAESGRVQKVLPGFDEVSGLLLPVVEKDRLVLKLESQELKDVLHKVLGPAFAKTRSRARIRASASQVKQILLGCFMYAEDHEGNWPQKLGELAPRYVQPQVLTNPRWPDREPGYEYRKPPVPTKKLKSPTRTVVIHGACTKWPEGGVAVGFADGHVRVERSESRLEKALKFGAPTTAGE